MALSVFDFFKSSTVVSLFSRDTLHRPSDQLSPIPPDVADELHRRISEATTGQVLTLEAAKRTLEDIIRSNAELFPPANEPKGWNSGSDF